jgi:FHA domain
MRDRQSVTGRDIVQDILANMRDSLEPLQYRTLAPNRFEVVLNGDDFDRLEGILQAIREDAARALDEAIHDLNRGSLKLRVLEKIGRPRAPVQGAVGDWQIEIGRDGDGELKPGMTSVTSSLELPGTVEYGSGNPTRRVKTIRFEGRVETNRETLSSSLVAPSAAPSGAGPTLVYGALSYEDNLGKHRYLITKDTVRVGRGGVTPEVDVQVQTSLLDISREHFRLRRDAPTAGFFISDLSKLGTTLDGIVLPGPAAAGTGTGAAAADVIVNGTKARIGLAGVLFMDLEIGSSR